jgi:hypothetical protein
VSRFSLRGGIEYNRKEGIVSRFSLRGGIELAARKEGAGEVSL